jgi:hypothetical protein
VTASFDPQVYDTLVKDTYCAELAGRALTLNASIPRIVKRYEEAFGRLGLQFNKTRPAREFLTRMGTNPAAVLPAASAGRFQATFKVIGEKYERLRAADREPFR